MVKACSRRGFLAAMSAAAMPAAPGRSVRLGAPIFLKSEDPRELAREHRRLGYSAAYCPAAKAEDTAAVRALEKAFAAENVAIAEVGTWVNMLDADAEKRRANMRFVIDRMALADAVGARCCVNTAGSYNPKVWYGPDPRNLSREFFDATVENCRRILDEVKPKRSKFTLEIMGWALPDGPDSYVRLIKAIDRTGFAVHLDVCNGINSPDRFYNSAKFIADCFEKLGPWIVSCHAKDLRWETEMNVHFLEVVPGRGQVDYRELLSQLAKLRVDAPLMLEHLKTAAEYDEGVNYIRGVARHVGVSFA